MLINILKVLLAGFFAAIVIVFGARFFFALPVVGERVVTTALPSPKASPLSDAVMDQWKEHPSQTGVAPLRNGGDAFVARMILADAAVSSIDAQYYIWRDDLTGSLLLGALKRAADRGVRVRLLLDDNGTSGLDPQLAALTAHENADVRLYNPFILRRFKMLSYGFDFFRLNRRMHNKSFIVDGSAAILGGRNIGDEYFDTGPTALYVDLDVLAVGEIVSEVASDFDRYWSADAVLPADLIVGPAPDGDPVNDAVRRYNGERQLTEYQELLAASDLVMELRQGTLDLEWTDAVLVSDNPIKGMGAVPREVLLASRLKQAVGEIETRFDGISPYFVPGAAGVDAFATLEDRGIQVRMLTNSLEATDVLPVHAGYSKRRRDLIEVGVDIFELQRRATVEIPENRTGPFGSSGASLHAKTFAVDGERIFIGSFNFDPRSTTLNTEMGLLIDSKTMAMQMHDAFDRGLDGLAWKVELTGGNLVWRNVAEEISIEREPGSTRLNRIAIMVIGWLPVEWLL